jgi:hypothetical protein
VASSTPKSAPTSQCRWERKTSPAADQVAAGAHFGGTWFPFSRRRGAKVPKEIGLGRILIRAIYRLSWKGDAIVEESHSSGQLDLENSASGFQAEEVAARTMAERLRRRVADRLKSINDHRVDTQDSPTARTAALRGICADLMEIEAHIAEALRDSLATTAMMAENIDEFSPAIDLVLRLSKQITQATQLEMRSAKHEV